MTSAEDWAEFEPFVRARLAALQRFGLALTGDAQAAADLLQDALERTALHWSSVRTREDPEGYVRRVMANRHVSVWRRRRRELLVAELADRPVSDRDVDTEAVVWQVLATLPRRQRAVLVLRYYEQLSEAEIAAVLGCSAGTVKSQAAKARAKVRAALAKSEEQTWTS